MSKDDADKDREDAEESKPSGDDEAESDAEKASADSETAEDESDDDEASDDEASDDDDESDESDDDAASADDDESDDDGESDEEESGDDGSDEDEADDRAAAASTAKKKSGGMTPGERLAAAKAKKAKKKLEKRGRQAEAVEDLALKRAAEATSWADEHRKVLLGGAAAIVLAVGGFLVWQSQSTARAAEASDSLWEVVEAAKGEIRAEGNIAADEDADGEIFESRTARAEAVRERAETTIADFPGTQSAVWARLEQGAALLDLARYDEARDAFSSALAEGGSNALVAWRALEGIAFTYEVAEDWDQAIARFTELRQSGDGAYRQIADYHMARMHLAKGDEVRAKELLAELLEGLREAEEGSPELSYVRSQTEIRLMEIDPSLVPASSRQAPEGFGVGGGGGPDDMSPEQIQELIRQLQERGGAGGAGGPPGAGGGGE